MHIELPDTLSSSSQDEGTFIASQSTVVDYKTTSLDESIRAVRQIFSSAPSQLTTPIRETLVDSQPIHIQDDIFQQIQLSHSFSLPNTPIYPQQQQQQQQQQVLQGAAGFFIPASIAPPQYPHQMPYQQHGISQNNYNEVPVHLAFPQQQQQYALSFPPTQQHSPASTSSHPPTSTAPLYSAAPIAPIFAPLAPSPFDQTFFATQSSLFPTQQPGPIVGQEQSTRVPGSRRKQGMSICTVCRMSETPAWRRHEKTGGIVCNACGLYYKLHKRDREFVVNSRGQRVVKRQPRGVSKRRRMEMEAQRQQRQQVEQQRQGEQQRQHAEQQIPPGIADTDYSNIYSSDFGSLHFP